MFAMTITQALMEEGKKAALKADHVTNHHVIEIGDSEHSVSACIECDEEVCPECGSNLVDMGDSLVCVGCGLTAC